MRTVLLGETDPELRQVYQQFLSRHRFHVFSVGSGLECLQHLQHSVPDVLILDRNLLWGGVEGILAWLKEQGISPRVILTGESSGSANALSLVHSDEIVAHFGNPIHLSDLLDVLQTTLEDERTADLPRSITAHAGRH